MGNEEAEARNAVKIIWQIKNFNHSEDKTIIIWSHDFVVNTLDGTKCYLCLRTTKYNTYGIWLLCREGFWSYPLDCECLILDSVGSPPVTKNLSNQLFNIGFSDIGIFPCLMREEVFKSKKHLFLPNDTLTIQLRIWKSGRELAHMEKISLLNRMEIRESSFLWPIKEFKSLQLDQEVDTPAAVCFSDDPQIICLKFLLAGESLLESKVKFQARDSREYVDSFFNFKVSVYGALQNIIPWEEWQDSDVTWIKTDKGYCKDFCSSVSRKSILDECSGCLENDILTLQCNMVHTYYTQSIINHDCGSLNYHRVFIKNASNSTEVGFQTVKENSDSTKILEERNDSSDILRRDLLFMYQEQTFCDFELRSGDTSIPVLKSVLSARSPVFRAMFSSDMHESKSNFLDVPDLDTHTLNRFLTFLYTGTIEDLQWEGAAKLYYAADKYDVASLKQVCTSTLRSSIAMSNVCDILILADRHQDDELISIVHSFILSDFENVMHSKEWDCFMEKNLTLAGKTTHQLCKKKYQPTKTQAK